MHTSVLTQLPGNCSGDGWREAPATAGPPSGEPPDKTEIADAGALKTYLAEDRIDAVAFSFLKHLATYATGRTLSYNELEFLREQAVELEKTDYRVLDAFRIVINSPVFLEK